MSLSLQVVEIHDINSDALQQIVDFAYSSQITLSPQNIQALLHAASVLQIDNLEFACCQYMKDKIMAHHNCLGKSSLIPCALLYRTLRLRLEGANRSSRSSRSLESNKPETETQMNSGRSLKESLSTPTY